MTEPYIQFDFDKFVDAVHFVCELFSDRPSALGQVKLHKILYFADMTAFFDRGIPITGCEYQRQPFGPTARYLGKALKQLEASGKIEVMAANHYGYRRAHFHVLAPCLSNRLDPYDKQLLRDVSDWASGLSAVEISELSHDLPWRSVKQGERIDYATAGWLFPRKGPTDADVAWAEETAEQIASNKVAVKLDP